MKLLEKVCCMILLMMVTGVQASNYEGKITQVLVGPQYGSKVFITMGGNPVQSGCHVNPTYHYAFDASTEAGKVSLSVILAAYAAQKTVKVFGNANCTVYAGVEDMRQLLAK